MALVVDADSLKKPSIKAKSSSESRYVRAPITPLTCSSRRKPTIAAVTAGLRKVHARATSPGVLPCRSAICFQDLYQLQVPAELGLLKVFVAAAPVVLGQALPARSFVIFPVSNPARMGE